MQSWGDASRFNQRQTRAEPTKSGILGLLAAAQGRRRTDPIEDLLGLEFGVRTEQPGTIVRDFQTEIDRRGTKPVSHPLTHRYYLSDAVFIAAVSGSTQLIEGLAAALTRPTFPLYLGRRSCPPGEPLLIGIREQANLPEVLRHEPWLAAAHHRHKQPAVLRLPIVRDAQPTETPHETIRDLPLSFSQEHRQYSWRDVVHDWSAQISNPLGRAAQHDPMQLLGDEHVSVEA